MPEWLQRRPGTRKATAEALRDHFKAKQWPVPMTGRTQWRPIRAVAAPGLLNGDRAVEPPEKPMTPDRIRWEHIQRIYELCNQNVSETARRLNMHRRTLQRILAKRAPK
jgi:hypothetical protein